MKTRQGFVSNSSSSSFIVCFHTMPKDRDDLQKMLFGDEAFLRGGDDRHGGNRKWLTSQVAQRVWDDMVGNELTADEALEEAEYEYDHLHAQEFIEKNRGGRFFEFSYGDHDGEFESDLERGSIFSQLPYLYINMH